MDREQLVEAMAEAMSTDQLQRRGQRIVPWADEPEMWKNEQRARARAALAVAEPVVREDEAIMSAVSFAALRSEVEKLKRPASVIVSMTPFGLPEDTATLHGQEAAEAVQRALEELRAALEPQP